MESKLSVLIVDDTTENIDVLAGILKDEYAIKIARNGQMALKIARLVPQPDIILLDIMMPVMDGYEVCEQLKNDLNTRHIPVIFVTAKISPEDELAGLSLGAVDYITKPVSPPLVMQRVKTHLAVYQQNRELDRRVAKQTHIIHETRYKIIQRLGRAAEYKDNETGFHVLRMSHYSYLLAKATGMTEQDAELILNAAPMHDIGKIGIPDHILLKPGKLDRDEWDVMQTHAQIGADIIGDSGGAELLELAKVVAITHHEKWNGKGYPHGISKEEIPLAGRIVAIADVFDALTSERPYKKAWTVDDALELINKEAGEHFDPALVPLFLSLKPQLLEIKAKFTD